MAARWLKMAGNEKALAKYLAKMAYYWPAVAA